MFNERLWDGVLGERGEGFASRETRGRSQAPMAEYADMMKSAIHEVTCACVACNSHNKDEGGESPVLVSYAGGDDIAGDLTTTGTLTPGSFVSEDIDKAGDTDWFAIDLVAGEVYTFTVYLPPGGLPDSVLTLRDAAGTSLAVNDDANLAASLLYSEITFTATESGTHYLDVSAFGSATGTYFLSSSRPVADTAGQSAATASDGLLASDTASIEGALDETGDRDWYEITLTAGETYVLETLDAGPEGNLDTTLTLRDASGLVQAYNDDSNGLLSRIRFTATESGTYYIDVGGWGDSQQGDYRLTFGEAEPLQEFSNERIAARLLYGEDENPSDLRRFDVADGDTLTFDVTSLTAEGAFLAREALALWSDVTGIRFQEVTGGAQITFQDTESGAFASSVRSGNFISEATVNVSTDWLASHGTTLNSYSFQTYIHEVGHALGLRHPGNYNASASYLQDALFLNDSWATSVMSYFSQRENTFFAEQDFSRSFAVTPMSGDIVAIQLAYGGATETRLEDSVYGVGNNTGRTIYGVDLEARDSQLNLLAFVIFDNGGVDTLDYSVFGANQRIDLNQETFSNVGGSIGNMSIARGTVIENAVGGDGNDTLIGNDAANLLTGWSGNDALEGGSNVDTAVVRGSRGEYTVTQTSTGVFEVVGPDGADTLSGVEFLRFDDQEIRLRPGEGVSVTFDTADPSVYQSAMEGIRDFDGNDLGGDGAWLRIGSADVNGDGDIDQILVNDAIGRFATVGTAPDGLVYFEDYSWAGETRVAGIYIDPLVEQGIVERFSDEDSQRRFQNDLQIENINRVLGADDYDGDGIQEVYFALTDGTAYLRALMHEDGNIRYANYQSEQEVIDYLTANGFGEETFGDWFGDTSSQTAQETDTDKAAVAPPEPLHEQSVAVGEPDPMPALPDPGLMIQPFEMPAPEIFG